MDFTDMIRYLSDIGVADVLFPFILIFTVIFAILQKAKILGGDEGTHRKFNVVIAMVMAFAVIIPHVLNAYPPGADVVDIMNSALPNVSVVIIAVLMLLLLIGIWGIEFAGGSISGWIALVSVIIVLYIFGSSAGWLWGFPPIFDFLNDPDTQAMIIIILVFGIIVYFITKEPKKPEGSGKAAKDISKWLNEGFKKK